MNKKTIINKFILTAILLGYTLYQLINSFYNPTYFLPAIWLTPLIWEKYFCATISFGVPISLIILKMIFPTFEVGALFFYGHVIFGFILGIAVEVLYFILKRKRRATKRE